MNLYIMLSIHHFKYYGICGLVFGLCNQFLVYGLYIKCFLNIGQF